MKHISDLTPDPQNARKHNPRNLSAIEQALNEVGAARSIVIDENGVVLAGNGLIEAAAAAGITNLQVVQADGETIVAVQRSNLTDAQKRRLALFDNRAAELAEWDPDTLQAMVQQGTDMQGLWTDDELLAIIGEQGGGNAGETDPDAVPDPPETAITKPGDLWILGDHRILCGSCTDEATVKRVMDGQRATLMATDPPYLVGYDGTSHPQKWKETANGKVDIANKQWDNYHEGDEALYDDFLRLALEHALDPYAPVYQWHADRTRRFVEDAWNANGMLWHQSIVWVKSRAVLGRSHFMWQSEPCAYGWLEGNQAPTNRRPPNNEPNVWMIPSVREDTEDGSNDRVEHPTQKPVETIARVIPWHTRPGEILYEPFSGSGTCIIAAEMTGRRCFALELEPDYVDVAVERWQNFTGQSAQKAGAA